jgi:hypothetical protein
LLFAATGKTALRFPSFLYFSCFFDSTRFRPRYNGKSAKSVKKRHSRFVANVARTRFRSKSKSLSGLDQSALGATRFRVRRTFAVVRLFKTSTRFSHR